MQRHRLSLRSQKPRQHAASLVQELPEFTQRHSPDSRRRFLPPRSSFFFFFRLRPLQKSEQHWLLRLQESPSRRHPSTSTSSSAAIPRSARASETRASPAPVMSLSAVRRSRNPAIIRVQLSNRHSSMLVCRPHSFKRAVPAEPAVLARPRAITPSTNNASIRRAVSPGSLDGSVPLDRNSVKARMSTPRVYFAGVGPTDMRRTPCGKLRPENVHETHSGVGRIASPITRPLCCE